MQPLPLRRKRLEKIKSYIRILSLISLFLIFCTGIFVQDSSIYAKDKERGQVLGLKDSIYKIENVTPRGFAPKTVTIRGNDFEKKVLVYSDLAKDILKEAKITIDSDDEILPSPKEYIPNMGVIVIVKVDSEIVTNLETIPYDVKEVKDSSMDKGTSVVTQQGLNGVLEKKIRVIYKDKVPFRSEIIQTTIITPPSDEVITVGTKPRTIANCDYWGKVVNDTTDDERERRWMKSVMYWESGCDSGKGLDKYFEGSNAFYGLFQFQPRTFYELFGGTDLWDGYNQIEIVHKMYNYYHNDTDLSRQWPTNDLFLKYYGDKYGPKK